jgi:hypothetical protein
VASPTVPAIQPFRIVAGGTVKSKKKTHKSNKMKRQRRAIDFLIGLVAVAAPHGPTLHLEKTKCSSWTAWLRIG